MRPATVVTLGVLAAVWVGGPGLLVAVLLGLIWAGSQGLRHADRKWKPDGRLSALIEPDRRRTRHPVASQRRRRSFGVAEWVYVIPWRPEVAAFDGEVAYVGFTDRETPEERWRDTGHHAQRRDTDAAHAVWYCCPAGEGHPLEDDLIDQYHEAGHRLLNIAGV